MARTGRDETGARGNKAVSRRNEAIGLTGGSKTVIARARRDEAFARSDESSAPGYGVVMVVVRARNRQATARADGTIGLRDRPQC